MHTQVLIGLLLTMMPVFELRGGLPIIMEYAVRNGLPIWSYFFLVLFLNILVVIFIFMLLDFLHGKFMKMRGYKDMIGSVMESLQGKVRRVEKRMDKWGYSALILLVAVPLPGTGAWTGAVVAWIMGLDRVKSFVAIAIGVIIAGSIMLLLSLGLLNGIY